MLMCAFVRPGEPSEEGAHGWTHVEYKRYGNLPFQMLERSVDTVHGEEKLRKLYVPKKRMLLAASQVAFPSSRVTEKKC